MSISLPSTFLKKMLAPNVLNLNLLKVCLLLSFYLFSPLTVNINLLLLVLWGILLPFKFTLHKEWLKFVEVIWKLFVSFALLSVSNICNIY